MVGITGSAGKLQSLLTRDKALFFDLDGTLLDLTDHPAAVHIPPDLKDVFNALQTRHDGAVAVVTGRPFSFIDRIFDNSVAAAGEYGISVRQQPQGAIMTIIDRPSAAYDHAIQSTRPEGLPEGTMLERHPFATTFHYRNVQEALHMQGRTMMQSWALAAAQAYNATSPRHPQGVMEASEAFELTPLCIGKGKAVEAFMSAAPFAGRTPVFFGDTPADRPGMEAARACGGFAVGIGAQMAGYADIVIATPQELRFLLRQIVCQP